MSKRLFHTGKTVLAAGLALVVIACGGGSGGASVGNISSTSSVPAPAISSFTAAKATLTAGESTTLTASFTNGAGTVDHSLGAVTSGVAVTVTPAATTTYALTVTNSQGATTTQTTTVTVVSAPAISSFTAAKVTITAGESTSLTASFTNGTGAVDHSLGAIISGTAVTVSPTATTTYALTVTNSQGATTTQTATVTVVPAPAINSFTVAKATITAGECTSLTASFTNGTGAVDHSLGAVTSGAAVTVTPAATTTYTLIVTNSQGATTTQTATVTVVPAPAISSFTAAKATITVGESTSLTASFTNGTGAVDHSLGAVTSGTAVTVTPAVTTTYSLTVTNSLGATLTQTATVTVVPAPAISSFTTSKGFIIAGTSSTLTASFTGGIGSVAPGNLPITSGGTIVVAPTVGTTYTLTVTNPGGAVDVKTTLISVRASNAAPTFQSAPPTSNGISSTYQYTIITNDPDGDLVTLTMPTAPAGAILSGSAIQWTIAKDQERTTAPFEIRATDSFGASATQTWTVDATGTIVGTRFRTYHHATGTQNVPVDNSLYAIAAWVPDGQGGFIKRAGVGAADGTFSIPGVPGGAYRLQLGTTAFHAVSASVLDLGDDAWGRPDAVKPTIDPTNLVLNLSNLSPWQDSDELQWYDDNTGTYVAATTLDFSPSGPLTGATTLSAATLNLKTFSDLGYGTYLMDTTKGDHPYLFQITSQNIPGTAESYRSLARIFQATPLVQTDGGTSALSGAFTTPPSTAGFIYNFNGNEFHRLGTAVHPSAQSYSSTFWLDAIPAGAIGYIGGAPDLITMNVNPFIGLDINLGVLPFGNPFPASWPIVWMQEYRFGVRYNLTGVANSRPMYGSISKISTAVPSGTNPVRPTLAPVRGVQVGGQPLTAPVAGVGLTPIITWQAPSLGTPTHSVVYVYRFYNNGTNTPAAAVVATLRTSVNNFQVPPGVLQQGETYFLKITTYQAPGYSETAPFRPMLLNFDMADCLTLTFQP